MEEEREHLKKRGLLKKVEGENREKARQWLQAVELHECPICGSEEGIHAGDLCMAPQVGKQKGGGYVMVPLTCLTCGHLFFFNAMRHWGGSGVNV